MRTSIAYRPSLILAVIQLFLCADLALGGEAPASEDPCAAWEIAGYRLGMPAAEAMAVRPVQERTSARYPNLRFSSRIDVVRYWAEPEPGRFKSAYFELSPDGRVRLVRVVLDSVGNTTGKEWVAALSARLGPAEVEGHATVGKLLPFRHTAWRSQACDTALILSYHAAASPFKRTVIEMGPYLAGNPSALIAGDADRDVFPGYSVAPPQGSGWRRAPENPARRGSTMAGQTMDAIYFGQPGPDGQSVFAAVTGAVRLVAPHSESAPRAAEVERALLITDTSRFQPVSTSQEPDPLRPELCTRYFQETRDLKAAGAPGPMALTLHGLVCSHPDFPDYIVHAMWSQRVAEGAPPIELGDVREAFFRGVELEPIGATLRTVRVSTPWAASISGAAVWVSSDSGRLDLFSEPGKLVRLDAATGEIVAKIPVGERPTGVVVTAEGVWVINSDDGTLSRVDPVGNKEMSTFRLRKVPAYLIEDAGSLWVTHPRSDRVSRFDPASGKVVAEIRVGDLPVHLTSCAGGIFVANLEDDTVSRIDPATNRVTATFEVEGWPGFSICHGGALWIALEAGNAVAKLDPSTGAVLGRYPVGHNPMGLAVHEGLLWVANSLDGTLSVLDPETGESVLGPIPAGAGPTALVVVGSELWIIDRGAGAIHRLSGSQAGP